MDIHAVSLPLRDRLAHLFTLDSRRQYPLLDRANGVYLWDTEGRQYLDAIAGITVANIEYGRVEIVGALGAQKEVCQ